MMIVIGFLFFSDDNKGLAEEPPIPSVVPISTLTPIPSPSYIALTDTPMPSPTQNGITYPQLTATVVARTTQSHEATVNAALTRVSNDSATETASSVAATLTAIYSQGVLDEQNTATAPSRTLIDLSTSIVKST